MMLSFLIIKLIKHDLIYVIKADTLVVFGDITSQDYSK